MREKGAGVGAFRIACALRGGMKTQFRWSRVSWDEAGREWEKRVCDRKALGEATREPGAIWHGSGEGFCAGGMVAREGAPDGTRCVLT